MTQRTSYILVRNAQGDVVRQAVVEDIPVAEENAGAIRTRIALALDENAAFLALTPPTNAQILAQVRMLTRECSALIRLFGGLLDSTDGT